MPKLRVSSSNRTPRQRARLLSARGVPGLRALLAMALTAGACGLSGCGVAVEDAAPVTTPADSVPLPPIEGRVHGGVLPIQGATVRLMLTQTSKEFWTDTKGATHYGGTYGGNNSANPLLMASSDSNGDFNFPTSGVTCKTDQFLYITVSGGFTGNVSNASTPNNSVVQVVPIGSCSQLYTGAAVDPNKVNALEVYASELSTVVAAYTLGGFMTVDDTSASAGQQIVNISAPDNNDAATGSCSSGKVCTAAGLTHAFANATLLMNDVNFNGALPTNVVYTATPNGLGLVPQALINTMGNVLQTCVDSKGGGSASYSNSKYTSDGSACGNLFAAAGPPGGPAPTNTLEAVLDIARFPGSNATALYNLQPPKGSTIFNPAMTSAPGNFAICIYYLTENMASNTGQYVYPRALTLDANDDVFVAVGNAKGTSSTSTQVLGLTSSGGVLFTGNSTGKLANPNGTYLLPTTMVSDINGDIWMSNNSATSGAILEINPANGAMSLGTALGSANGLAVDQANNLWVSVAATSGASIVKYPVSSLTATGRATTVSPALQSRALGASLGQIALDAKQNVFSITAAASAVGWLNGGSVASPSYTVGTSNTNPSMQNVSGSNGLGVAVNASNVAFFPTSNSLSDASFSGTNLTTGGAAVTSTPSVAYNDPNQAAVDGAGNIFFADYEAAGQVYKFVPSPSGNLNQGTLTTFLPCYPYPQTCTTISIADLQGMQVDSTGTIWFTADAVVSGAPIGVLVQAFGLGVPSWPVLFLGKPGVEPN